MRYASVLCLAGLGISGCLGEARDESAPPVVVIIPGGPAVDSVEAADAGEPPDGGDGTDAGQATDAGTHDAGVPLVDDATVAAANLPSTMACGAQTISTVTVTNTGTTVWTRAAGYKLGGVDDSDPFRQEARVWLPESAVVAPSGSFTFELPLTAPGAAGQYTTDWRMVHEGERWFGATHSAQITVACAANRTPDPPAGQALPLPNMRQAIEAVHAANPQLIEQSCQDTGGSWAFMDAVLDELRQTDTRWGYNWKRGVVGSPSQDVIDYHYSAGPDEGSTDVYIIDIIGGHCGPNPGVAWNDVTQATLQGGTVGKWTGRGRF